MKISLHPKTILFALVLFSAQLFSQVYIDYKVRTDDFYAQTFEDGVDITYADPTWRFRFQIRSGYSSGSWSSWECINSTNGDASGTYNNGEWFNQDPTEYWSGTCLDNADNIFIGIEGWEEENGTPCVYETSDDDYSSDTYDRMTDLSGSVTRGGIFKNFINTDGDVDYVDCGTFGNDGYYKIEFDVWWDYSLPVEPLFELSDRTTNGFTITKTSNENYRITSWDYQISINASFTNIIYTYTGFTNDSETIDYLEDNFTYYVRIRGSNEAGDGDWSSGASIKTIGEQIWDGSFSNSWNDVANWDEYYAPTTDDHVIITSNGYSPIIYSGDNANTYNLTINEGATLTIEDGASLITAGTIINNGTVNIEKSISNGQWHLVSAPVSGIQSGTFTGDYLQYWDETSASWIEIPNTDFGLNTGVGYGLFPVAKNDYVYTKTPNNGPVPVGISYTAVPDESRDGANLLGNPYPSSIDWNQVSGFGAVYYWDGSQYLAYPETGGYGTGLQYIPPMQAFFIVVPDNDPSTFTFTNDMRTHSGASNYYKSDKVLENGILLSALSNGLEDDLLIRYMPDASEEFEIEKDALKLKAHISGKSEIWTKTDENELSIDVRDNINTIQLGYANDQNGYYSISIKEADNIGSIELEDTKLNQFHDLSKGAYAFGWNNSDSEERFILHLKATGTNDMEAQAVQVYAANGQVYVRMDEANDFDQIMVYDLAGRLVFESPLNKEMLQSIELNQPVGAYLVQLIGEKSSLTEKVIVD